MCLKISFVPEFKLNLIYVLDVLKLSFIEIEYKENAVSDISLQQFGKHFQHFSDRTRL